MRRIRLYIALMMLLFVFGVFAGMVALAQSTAEDEDPQVAFRLVSEIGRALPRSILYDPAQERMAVIDAYNRLLIIDAETYQTQHVLYERGNYNDLAFSNNGQYLALAISSRIELWDTETGALVADLVDLGQAIRIKGPIAFSRDDDLLIFRGIYPAPRSIRVTENQTIEVPWIWNLTAARNEGQSTFPRGVEAWQFFDYRNGFELGPENRLVAALPGRLQVLDAYSLQVLFEIPTDRYETDPLTTWFSLRDNTIYVRPVTQNALVQVDTQGGVLTDFPLDEWLTVTDLEALGGVELGSQARLIGPPNSRRTNDLLQVLLGTNYRRFDIYRFRPLTVTLIDLVIPPAATGENVAALLFIFDEQEEIGRFVLSRQFGVDQMVLSPDNQTLMIRSTVDGEERVLQYDLSSGDFVSSFIPALRAIGRYSRISKNRVLAYDDDGDVIISDFQRVDADSPSNVLAEDLRYSRRFDRFYFSDDATEVVTMSGSEWRVWSVETGQVMRREVLDLRGNIIRTSSDGFEFLTQFGTSNASGVQYTNLRTNEVESVNFMTFRGRGISQVIPNATWDRFFVIYDVNPWGQYTPGNEVAMYSFENGLEWFIAGDDLPPSQARRYGWVDSESVFVYGEGPVNDIPNRVYELEYAPSGLPACAVAAFPDAVEEWTDLWERLVNRVRPDALSALTQLICADLPDTPAGVEELLRPTPTAEPRTPTPVTVPGVPVCLTARYPDEADAYAEVWRRAIVDLSPQEIAELEVLLCEGIGEFNLSGSGFGEFESFTMIINAETGERATGSFEEEERVSRPIFPIQELFEDTEDRALGTAILSGDAQFVAASSLPGELVVYQMLVSYDSLLAELTATAVAQLESRNLIAGLPSPTPTYNIVGTPRPTLTPTVTPTHIPPPEERVEQPQYGEVVDLCPADTLYTVDALPDGYAPGGQLIGPVQGDFLWTIDPATGRRGPDETVPQCGGIDCNFSPDNSWILARTTNEIYVVRPDGSDPRVLYDFEEDRGRIPPFLNWSGPNTLEFEVQVDVELPNGQVVQRTALQRDILGVFPDPEPWIPQISINTLSTDIISRQPGGPWMVARTTFSTGVNAGYKYYLYHRDTRESIYFARLTNFPTDELSVSWHPIGDRLFYRYPVRSGRPTEWYQFDLPELTHRYLGNFPGGTWSDDGRYRAYRTDRRTQPVAVWDSQTGLTRTYCIPETGARLYDGDFTWSPDGRYVALQTFLPADENVEGVGQHTLILDIETGAIVDLTTGVGDLIVWSRDPGEYAEEE